MSVVSRMHKRQETRRWEDRSTSFEEDEEDDEDDEGDEDEEDDEDDEDEEDEEDDEDDEDEEGEEGKEGEEGEEGEEDKWGDIEWVDRFPGSNSPPAGNAAGVVDEAPPRASTGDPSHLGETAINYVCLGLNEQPDRSMTEMAHKLLNEAPGYSSCGRLESSEDGSRTVPVS